MRRFRVDSLPNAGATIALDADGSHHLLDVVRIARGESVLVFDGAGFEARATLTDIQGGAAVLIVDEAPRPCRPAHPLTLVLGTLKGPAMDDAIRMATEAGATAIRPFTASRSIATGSRVDRWQRVALSAAQQCGRGDLPALFETSTLREVLAALAAHGPCDLRVAVPGAPRLGPADGPAAVVVGPEGGLVNHEVEAVLAAGGRACGLGRFVLRADTAAAVAVAMTSADGA